MRQEVFLKELEERLEENRRIVRGSLLPSWLHGVASYLGFHTFRVLVLAGLIVTVIMFWWQIDMVIYLSKKLFLL